MGTWCTKLVTFQVYILFQVNCFSFPKIFTKWYVIYDKIFNYARHCLGNDII